MNFPLLLIIHSRLFSAVHEIERIVEQDHVSDMFLGLILVPLVEKLAEHLTAVDEAWDNQVRKQS